MMANKNIKSLNWELVEMSVTPKELNTGDPVIFPFNSSVWPLEKQGVSWRLTADFHKHDQVLVPLAAAMLDGYLF